MNEPFFSRRNGVGLTNALLILMVVFFFVPFALRGARMALQKTENNVKDWLPDSFRETEELSWFAKHFVSEQFILATWKGCSQEDQRLKLLVDKLRAEQALPKDANPNDDFVRARLIGSEYMLFAEEDLQTNWGGEQEKWLRDDKGRAYYITPEGKLYRWEGRSNMVGDLWRRFQKLTGSFRLEGQFIAGFGGNIGEGEANPFYRDPRLLTAPLFSRIQTGPELVEELAGEGGPLHRTGGDQAAQREAIDRLTGTLFAPAVPFGFEWTAESVREILPDDLVATFPKGWEERLALMVDEKLKNEFGGSKERLLKADPIDQAQLWYSLFDEMGVTEPPRQTCLLVTLTDAGRKNLKHVIGRGMMGTTRGRLLQLSQDSGVTPPVTPTTLPPPFSWMYPPPEQQDPILRMGGPPVDNVAIDEEGTITLVRLVGYSVALGLVLSWLCLRSIKLTIMVFFVGGVSAIASLSVVWWSNATVDAILLTMPSLVYVLGMAGAIHIINYYRDVVIEEGPEGAPEKALRHAFMPCLLANITTAFGLVSLCISDIAPIRKFGAFSAISVMGTLVLIYLYVPSALSIFVTKVASDDSKKGPAQPIEYSTRAIDRFWNWLGTLIVTNRTVVNIACVMVIAVFSIGLFQIKTSVHLLKMFDKDAQIIQDYSWLEQNFGRLVPLELVVRFPTGMQRAKIASTVQATTESTEVAAAEPVAPADIKIEEELRRLSLLERAEAVELIQRVVEREFGYSGADVLGHGMSALTLLRDLPDPSRGFNANRLVFDRLLQESFVRLTKTDYLRTEGAGPAEGTELWRISLRLGALNDVDYGQFISQLRLAVEPVVAAYKCRSEVIDQIVEATKETPERRKGTVLVLGASNPLLADAPAEETTTESAADDSAKDGGDATGAPKNGVNMNRIFAEALAQLLLNDAVQKASWHDPARFPLKDGQATSEKWGKYLSNFSSVIIVADHPDYDWEFVRKYHPNAIDVRNTLSQIEATASDDRVATGLPTEITPSKDQLDVIYTGVVPIVYKAQRTLLNSLIESTFWAFVTIAPVMALILLPAQTFLENLRPYALFKAFSAGMISMVPNVFPIVLIFGSMGFAGMDVDIGSMMTASVAMGIAVDDTIHFLTWFRGGVRLGLPRIEAVMYAYRRVAPAMTQTAIVGGVGLSVFALSTFTPTQRFGTLMLTILSAAVLGDLIFLPAILASPIGKLFMPFPDKKNPVSEPSSDDSIPPGGDGDGPQDPSETPTPLAQVKEAMTGEGVTAPRKTSSPSVTVAKTSGASPTNQPTNTANATPIEEVSNSGTTSSAEAESGQSGKVVQRPHLKSSPARVVRRDDSQNKS